MRDWHDFNGDGIVDAGEEYLAFRVWEEMCRIEEDETDLPDEEQDN